LVALMVEKRVEKRVPSMVEKRVALTAD